MTLLCRFEALSSLIVPNRQIARVGAEIRPSVGRLRNSDCHPPFRNALAIVSLLAASHFPVPSAATHHGAPAPAPSVDCSSLILSMADCLSFVSNGSTVTKPEKSCCSGLKTVLSTDAECLCEAFKSSGQLGVVLNVSKALTLPAACKLSAPSVSACDLSQSPAGAPALSPAVALGPTAANEPAPVPSPGNSAPAGCAVSLGYLISAAACLLFLTLNSI